MTLFEVEIMRPTAVLEGDEKTLAAAGATATGKRIKIQEFYVADHITQVIAKLELEFKDQDCEVTMIRAAVPVLAILKSEEPKSEET